MAVTYESPFPWSTSDAEVASACRSFYARLLRIDPGVEDILEISQRHPEESSVNLASAFLWLFAQTPEGQAQSATYLDRLEPRLKDLNPRETAWFHALSSWHAKAFEQTAQAFEAITSRWPEDLPAVKAAEFIYYILGQQESGPRFLAHMQRLTPSHSEDPDFLAMHAFAHELCGQTAEAHAYAEKALAITPHNPWAQHALEHALLWEGSPKHAVDRMETWLTTWDSAGRVIHCHNAWHVALMHLDRLNPERAFAIYEAHVWGKSPEMVVEQLDAIAFLWRAEMAGVVVDPQHYQAIVPYMTPLAETLFMPFISAHYAYALARAGEIPTLNVLLKQVDARAEESDAEAIRVWAPAGRNIIHGAAALGRNDARAATRFFGPAIPHLTRIGGSDAQDDLFRFAYFDSLRRDHQSIAAKSWLERRMQQKTPSPLEEKLLAEV